LNTIFIIAHAPLASALRSCALHVFPDCGNDVLAMDVSPNAAPEETLASARIMLEMAGNDDTLILADIFGATPCNVAKMLTDGVSTRLVTGVNMPMLVRCVNYRAESLETLVTRALAGGAQGVMQVAVTAPQNQTKKPNDPNHNHHQQ
jgi:mannose PTS system EIIA component